MYLTLYKHFISTTLYKHHIYTAYIFKLYIQIVYTTLCIKLVCICNYPYTPSLIYLVKIFSQNFLCPHIGTREIERQKDWITLLFFAKFFFFSTSLVTYLEKCPSSLHKMGEKIIWTKGLTSADRSNKATLLLTVPRSI